MKGKLFFAIYFFNGENRALIYLFLAKIQCDHNNIMLCFKQKLKKSKYPELSPPPPHHIIWGLAVLDL
jgi:hypothetical protein